MTKKKKTTRKTVSAKNKSRKKAAKKHQNPQNWMIYTHGILGGVVLVSVFVVILLAVLDKKQVVEPDPEVPVGELVENTKRTTDTVPAWIRYAASAPDMAGRIPLVVVIDDLGIDPKATKRLEQLSGPLTLSFLPYARGIRKQAAEARSMGHEIMLHVPMEPSNEADPGPDALLSIMSARETYQVLGKTLDQLPGIVGINNHMGSKLTASKVHMQAVMRVLHERGLLFLDSRTTPQTVGAVTALATDVPTVARDVFLDNDKNPDAIRLQLEALETTARQQGFAVAIGHPYAETAGVLAEWLPTLQEKGFVLVPLTALIKHISGESEIHG